MVASQALADRKGISIRARRERADRSNIEVPSSSRLDARSSAAVIESLFSLAS